MNIFLWGCMRSQLWQDLLLWHPGPLAVGGVPELQGSVVAVHWLNCARMWVLLPGPGTEPGLPELQGGILTTRSPGKFCMNILKACHTCFQGFPGGSVSKESTCNAGDTGDAGSIPGSGRSPGGGRGNPLR